MKVEELIKNMVVEQVDNFISEGSPISSELKDLINQVLEKPLDNVAADIQRTVGNASAKMKTWALQHMHGSNIVDNSRKDLLAKIINDPDTVARELALNIIKRKARI